MAARSRARALRLVVGAPWRERVARVLPRLGDLDLGVVGVQPEADVSQQQPPGSASCVGEIVFVVVLCPSNIQGHIRIGTDL